jgi:hypothetical protein
MQILIKTLSVISLFTLFSACQPSTDIKQVLSKSETRMAMMDTIANNNEMSKEMMEAMMKSEMAMQGNPKMHKMMMEDHGAMMKMMKEDSELMKSMMNDMMEVCKTDTSMMASLCKTMMANKPMMDMMGKMKGKNMDMKH